jgi:hypothetical protein
LPGRNRTEDQQAKTEICKMEAEKLLASFLQTIIQH